MALSIAASEYFEGNDGFWSTFSVNIGPSTTFYQQVRLLPATSESAIFVILDGAEGGCTESQCNCTETQCLPSGRGGVFDPNFGNGTGWSRQYPTSSTSLYFEIPFYSEQALNYTGTCEAGFDSLQLIWSGQNAPEGMLANQVIAPFEDTLPCWLGLLGINGRSSHMFNASSAEISPLQSLQQSRNIDNLYWGYTAGAYYRNPQVFGSLTFGGYDAARVDMDLSVTANFSTDSDRDLLVEVNKIEVAGESTHVFQGAPIPMMIDSVVTDIWLPKDVCTMFEQALGLVWNDSIGMYLINETQHSNLVTLQPNVSFTLTSGDSSSNTVITLPYGAFDLTAYYPLANISNIADPGLRYFPIKQTTNPYGYFLGRTFLQEAYVTADYNRQIFTVGPAILPSNNTTNIKIVQAPNGSHGLGVGSIVGIAIGGAVAIVLAIGFLLWRCWWRSRMQKIRASRSFSLGNTTITASSDIPDREIVEYYKVLPPKPLEDGAYFKSELDATATATATNSVGQQMQAQELEAGSIRPSLGHRHQSSWASTGSAVSPMGEGIFNNSGEPSPPIDTGGGVPAFPAPVHIERQLSGGSRRGPFEME